jgi:hypothetical protein
MSSKYSWSSVFVSLAIFGGDDQFFGLSPNLSFAHFPVALDAHDLQIAVFGIFRCISTCPFAQAESGGEKIAPHAVKALPFLSTAVKCVVSGFPM